MANFIEEIDALACMHNSEDFPVSREKLAYEMEQCIQKDETPSSIRFALLKLTTVCNSDCEYCSHALSRNKSKIEISMSDLGYVVSELRKMNATACTLSGGEPLTYKYINEAVEMMRKNRIEPVLLTNGILLPQRMDQLYEAGLRYVMMSLDSLQAEHYSKIRGVDFVDIMKAYDYMIHFAKRHQDVIYRLTTVISEENIDDVIPLFEKVMNDGVGVQFTPCHRFSLNEKDLRVRDIKKIQTVINKLLEYKAHGKAVCNSKSYLSFFPEFFASGNRLPDGYKCKSGFSAIYIWPNLDVRSCWSAGFSCVGNLKEKSLAEIWQSLGYKKQRMRMLSCDCEGCWLLCTAEFNMTHENYLRNKVGD